MLVIDNLHVSFDGKSLLKAISLKIENGETHILLGPNGAGKSTLCKALAGHKEYSPKCGTMTFKGKNLETLKAEERVHEGLFIGFQTPVEIPGLLTLPFLQTIYNAKRKARGEKGLSTLDFKPFLLNRIKEWGIEETFLDRSLNTSLSGGEKKWSELLQMSVLEPDLAILDEIDSGLDVDALRKMAHILKKKTLLLITHNPSFIDILEPDFIHILCRGEIVKSGGREVIKEWKERGFNL